MTEKKRKPSVWIIFNPNSTGHSKQQALGLAKKLQSRGIVAECVPTKRAGHAEKLAKTIAETNRNPIVFSSSGDGGYNEVVNGVLKSKKPNTICGVLPAGNANDHYHAVHTPGLADRIAARKHEAIDCIQVQYGSQTRYAHSYIGLGLTPQIGQELTKRKLNFVIEKWVVLTKLFKITPVTLRHQGRTERYDHVVISNIPKMSKYITVGPGASVTDGVLELTTVKSGSFVNLLRHLVRRVVTESAVPKQIDRYEFTCARRTLLQLDGEVVWIEAGEAVAVQCAPRALRSIT